MTTQIDYEKYALKRPGLHCSNKYPTLYSRAIEGLTGTYADIGAGDGIKLAHSIGKGDLSNFSRIIAYDISAERIHRIQELIPSVECVVANAEHLPLADGSVDFYFSDQVIEHVNDDGRMAAEIRRVLKPGGRALIGSTIKARGAWYFYRCNGRWVIDPTHLREYRSMNEFRSIFERAGLSVVATALEPTVYSIGDLALRAVTLSGILKIDRVLKSPIGGRFIHWLAARHIRIPRYWLCYALVQREMTD